MQPEDFEKTKRSSGPLRLIAFSAAGFILLGALAVAAGNCAGADRRNAAAASPLQISEYMSSNNAVPDSSGNLQRLGGGDKRRGHGPIPEGVRPGEREKTACCPTGSFSPGSAP